jgi:iron(III) transport system substrate-binding protein
MKKIILILIFSSLCLGYKKNVVIVYSCWDQVYSEPILKEFERKTGIKVKAIYDIEATKTTGLVNKLIAEKKYPRCDVFWNNEIARTILLKNMGILSPYISPNSKTIPEKYKDKDGYWTGFAARARVIIYNKNLVKRNEIPKSILELTNPKWKNKAAIANPLFGTTSTHMTALFVLFGKKKAKEFFKKIKENKIIITFGNSIVKDQVANGELYWGITDTDDCNVAIKAGKPVGMVFPDQDSFGTLIIPNTVALVKNAPHAENAKKLIDFLLSRDVEIKLAKSTSIQIPLHKGIQTSTNVPDIENIKSMDVDYEKIAEKIQKASSILEEIFLR